MRNYVLIDASNVAYYIANILNEWRADTRPNIRQQVDYVNRRSWMALDVSVQLIWCLDKKPYWRSWYEPEYKANRTSNDLSPLVERVLDFIEETCITVSVPEYEGDDIASGLIQTLSYEHLWVLSNDSDWLGFIGQKVTGLNPSYEPRIKTRIQVWDYVRSHRDKLSRVKQNLWALPSPQSFQSPNIWDWKSVVGDPSDNLPEDTHPGLIDLIEPLQKVWETSEFKSQIEQLKYDPLPFDPKGIYEYSKLPDLPFTPIHLGSKAQDSRPLGQNNYAMRPYESPEMSGDVSID